jgi:hypothetical protein
LNAGNLTQIETQYDSAMADTATLYGNDVRAWAPFTVYAAGQAVVNPSGDVVTAIAAHTSGASYTATNWTLSSTFVQANEAPLTPYQFGAIAPTASNDNTTALTALWAAASAGSSTGGASIYLPPGIWRTTTALPLVNSLVVRGAGRIKSRLVASGTNNLFEWSTNILGLHIEDLDLECDGAGKGIFAPQGSGGMYGSTINNCFMYAATDTSFIWSQNNAGSFIHMAFRDCEMQRTVGSTVVPFSVITTVGGANFNKFENVRFDGANNIHTPFLHVESNVAGSYVTDWVLTGILGEQNPGGLMAVYGADNWTVINATDEDSSVTYVDNLISFQNGTGGDNLAPNSITILNSGRRGQSMTAGKFDISVSTSARNVALIACNPGSGTAPIQVPAQSFIANTRGFPFQFVGTGTPLGTYAAPVGSTFIRTDGGTSTTFYVKESATDATGWVAK